MSKVEIPIKETYVDLNVAVNFPPNILNLLALTEPDRNPTKWLTDELHKLVREYNHRLYELKMPRTKVSIHDKSGKWAKRSS